MTTKLTAFGIAFDSAIERDRYLILRAQQDAGELSDLEAHPVFDITPEGQRRRRYTADFRYRDARGCLVVEEVKPTSRKARSWTRDVRLRMDMARAKYPECQFVIVEM